jgi:hypothetical protein
MYSYTHCPGKMRTDSDKHINKKKEAVPPSFTDVTSTHTIFQTRKLKCKQMYFINYLDKLPSRDLVGGMKYIKFWLLVISNVESHYPILML